MGVLVGCHYISVVERPARMEGLALFGLGRREGWRCPPLWRLMMVLVTKFSWYAAIDSGRTYHMKVT